MMKNHPDLFLRIEGHTDNTGDSDDNLRLSAQRALAIEAMLVDDHVDKKRLDAVGVGGLQPLADNSTPEGREKNRRIELVMWKKYPAFHAPAPNGQNYYPNPGPSDGSSRAGL
jgi:outer membrane protein OmpA-like peptidoglycan-associated protein